MRVDVEVREIQRSRARSCESFTLRVNSWKLKNPTWKYSFVANLYWRKGFMIACKCCEIVHFSRYHTKGENCMSEIEFMWGKAHDWCPYLSFDKQGYCRKRQISGPCFASCWTSSLWPALRVSAYIRGFVKVPCVTACHFSFFYLFPRSWSRSNLDPVGRKQTANKSVFLNANRRIPNENTRRLVSLEPVRIFSVALSLSILPCLRYKRETRVYAASGGGKGLCIVPSDTLYLFIRNT